MKIIYENFFQLSPLIEKFVSREKPATILEISAGKRKYGAILKNVLESDHISFTLDRINLNDDPDLPEDVYNNIYGNQKLNNIKTLNKYDLVFVSDLLENITIIHACNIIKILLDKTNKAIIAMTPIYPYDKIKNDGTVCSIRGYHPIVFSDFDFSYFSTTTAEGSWQFYSFFPPRNYPALDIDNYDILSEHDRNNKLKIAYVLPHKNLTGGMKTLLEQMRQLTKRGHKVFAYLKSDATDSALPEWCDLDANNDIERQVVIPKNREFSEYIKGVDVIVVGWMAQLTELRNINVPIVLWEQGSEYLYGDYGQLLVSDNQTLMLLRNLYRTPVYILGVSEIVISILRNKYGRKAHLLPNGIDTQFYYPARDKIDDNRILLIGNPSLKFKGFYNAIEALEKAYMDGARFNVDWICQTKPNISGINFPINFIVMPSQEQLASIIRNSDIFLSTSLYESFPLPPFEAMASGVAVIATDCGGIREYAREGQNILLSEQGDIQSLTSAIIYLLNDPEARHILSAQGVKTTQKYSFEKIILRLEDCLYSIVNSYQDNEVMNFDD